MADKGFAQTQAEYQIALRRDDLGLDDIVVKDVAMFRMERMDNDRVWLACYLEDGQDIHFDLWVDDEQQPDWEGNPKPTVRYEHRELPHVVYEEQK